MHISLSGTLVNDRSFMAYRELFLQNVGLPKWTSTKIRQQEVHSNGPVLDDTILADPEVSNFLLSDPVS